MAQLLVRNIDEAVVQRLKIRAARRGLSAEAEHREILKAALMQDARGGSLRARLLEMPDVGEDEDFLFEREFDRDG